MVDMYVLIDPAKALAVKDYFDAVEDMSAGRPIMCRGHKCHWVSLGPISGYLYDRDGIEYNIESGKMALLPWVICDQLHQLEQCATHILPGRKIAFTHPPKIYNIKGIVTATDFVSYIQINTMFHNQVFTGMDSGQLAETARDLCTHIAHLESLLIGAGVPFPEFTIQ